jgi:exodeoxyribonuclease VII large subunit
LRVGVLTSLDSDGWNDFEQQLRGSGFGFAVTCHAVRVQGPELRPTMLAGLHWFAERSADHDVLCILRGGGSRSDLAWFDDREVALAVARHPLPVLCGIGHQRDQSILDVIARSQKTPTAAGAWLVDQVRAAAAALDERRRRVAVLTVGLLAAKRAQITKAAATLGQAMRARVGAERQSLADSARRLRRSTTAALTQQRQRRDRDAADLRRGAKVAVERERARIERFAARQRLLDPARVLERGYALVRDTAGGVVARSAGMRPGMALDIAFADGHAHATTTRVFENQGDP